MNMAKKSRFAGTGRGGRVVAIDTYHFKPACKDFDL